MAKLKFDYGETMTINSEVYIKYKDMWWNIAIVFDYENVPGNDSAADVLEDMEMDTAFENNLKFSKFGFSYLVNYKYL